EQNEDAEQGRTDGHRERTGGPRLALHAATEVKDVPRGELQLVGHDPPHVGGRAAEIPSADRGLYRDPPGPGFATDRCRSERLGDLCKLPQWNTRAIVAIDQQCPD